MQITHISPDFATCPQIGVADVRRAVEAGYTIIICNRPDGESRGQPKSEDIARAATEAGAGFHYLPITHGQSTRDEAEKLSVILASGDGPVLAYCASGMRSAALWSACNNQTLASAGGNTLGRKTSGISAILSAIRFPFRGTAAD